MISVCIPSNKKPDQLTKQMQEILEANNGEVPDIQICVTAKDQSAAKNRNECIEKAIYDKIVMMDDDVSGLRRGLLSDFLKYWTNTTNILSARPLRPSGELCALLGDNDGKISRDDDLVEAIHTDKTELNIVGSACIMFEKTHIRFDENYLGATYEDSDFCMQMNKEFPEKKIYICNRINVIHNMEAKGRGTSEKARDNWKHNKDYFAKKWGIKI